MINEIKAIPGYETLTAQEIADYLNAIPVTRSKIALGDLLFLLNNRGMLVRLIRPADTGEKWAGSVVNMIVYVNDKIPEFAPGVNQWFSHITNDRNNYFDTTLPEYGYQLRVLTSQFGGQPTMPTVEDFEAIAGLGGGWKYSGVTAEQVQAELDADSQAATLAVVDAAVVAAKNEIINIAESDPSRTKQSLADAYRQAAKMLEQ